MPGVIQTEAPGMAPKLELFLSNSRCFHRLFKEQAEPTPTSQNKIM